MKPQTLKVRFYGPNGLLGRLICWTTNSPYCHINMEIGPGAVLEVPLFAMSHFYPALVLDRKRPPLVTHEIASDLTAEQVAMVESYLNYQNQPWRTVYHWFRHRRLDLSHNCMSMSWEIISNVTRYLYSPRNLTEMEAYLAQTD